MAGLVEARFQRPKSAAKSLEFRRMSELVKYQDAAKGGCGLGGV